MNGSHGGFVQSNGLVRFIILDQGDLAALAEFIRCRLGVGGKHHPSGIGSILDN